MNKKVLYILIVLFAFIGVVNAEKCIVITGSGKNIGDEIACGTEHFYVISNDGENVKMLAKYNLMAGETNHYVETDGFSTTYYQDLYTYQPIRDFLDKGYYYSNSNYEYDSSTSTYNFTGVRLSDEYLREHKIIWLNNPVSTQKEAITSNEAKKELTNNYEINNYIKNKDGQYIGISVYSYNYNNHKTIYLDGQQRTFGEMAKTKEIKDLLDKGYYIQNKYYNHSISISGTNIIKRDYYAVTLTKYLSYDYYTVMFDDVVDSSNITNVINTNENIQSKISDGYEYNYYSDYYYDSSTKTYKTNYYGVYMYKNIPNNYYNIIRKDLFQNSEAIGAKGPQAPDQWPEVGVVTYYSEELDKDLNYAINEGNVYGGDTYIDLSFNNDSTIKDYLTAYKMNLTELGINTSEVTLLAVSDLDEIAKKVTGENIPLEEWYNMEWTSSGDGIHDDSYIVGSIKNILSDEYKWIWSTTYWTRTLTALAENDYQQFFIGPLGDLCSTDGCGGGEYVGAGLRPVITILSADLLYNIETKTDGNGTVTPSTETEHSGNEVTFVVTPNEGFELKEVKVTDSNGNPITFTDYKFTMPDANVVIEAIFVAENPETTAINIIVSIILVIISVGIIIRFKKKANWLNR